MVRFIADSAPELMNYHPEAQVYTEMAPEVCICPRSRQGREEKGRERESHHVEHDTRGATRSAANEFRCHEPFAFRRLARTENHRIIVPKVYGDAMTASPHDCCEEASHAAVRKGTSHESTAILAPSGQPYCSPHAMRGPRKTAA